MADGYTPYQDAAEFWDPQSPINVVLGTLTGSADGYNNWAFFFAGNVYIGHDASTPSMQLAIAEPHRDHHHAGVPALRAERPHVLPDRRHPNGALPVERLASSSRSIRSRATIRPATTAEASGLMLE